MAPIVDAELNFVLERILKHREIVKQVVPEGGTWKRVVDKLNVEQRKRPGTAATLYNKAKLGQGIIDAIAEYTAAGFRARRVFSAFISKVDAFITTQSILQRRKFPLPKHRGERGGRGHDPGDGEVASMAPGGVTAAPGRRRTKPDEWDF